MQGSQKQNPMKTPTPFTTSIIKCLKPEHNVGKNKTKQKKKEHNVGISNNPPDIIKIV